MLRKSLDRVQGRSRPLSPRASQDKRRQRERFYLALYILILGNTDIRIGEARRLRRTDVSTTRTQTDEVTVRVRHDEDRRGSERLPARTEHGDVRRDAGGLLWQETDARPEDGDRGYQGSETGEDRVTSVEFYSVKLAD